MTTVNLADLRKSSSFLEVNEIIHVVNGRKKVDMGYFIPISFKSKFEKFLDEIEREERKTLLKRVASASRKDKIGDGAVSDGI